MKPPFLSKRGNVYQFSRRVPDDVRPVIGEKHWRWSLWTDSFTEAKIACRRDTVATDEIIAAVKAGTYRRFDDSDLDLIAFYWSSDFQQVNRQFIPRDLFPDAFEDEPRIGDEATDSILRTRSDVAESLNAWLTRPGTKNAMLHALGKEDDKKFKFELTPSDTDALIDVCINAYHVANPELSNSWKTILDELLAEKTGAPVDVPPSYAGVVPYVTKESPNKRLSCVFEDYKSERPDLAKGTEKEWALAVRRFTELHGDMDVTKITKSEARKYRDMLRRLPRSSPNAVRKLGIMEQADWADSNKSQRLSAHSINKHIQGMSSVLRFSALESEFEFPLHWSNPFEGLQKKSKSEGTEILPFSNQQTEFIFSDQNYQPRTPEKFWLPLVLLWTGARVEEIAQLHVADVQFDKGPHIVVENAEAEEEELAKNVKTLSSNRRIPIADELQEVGFLAYYERVKALGHVHLFPGVSHGVERK